MTESLFSLFCHFVDSTIFARENSGDTVAFIVDQAFIDEFCKKYNVSEGELLFEVRRNLYKSQYPGHLHIKGILAIQLYAATKREDSGGITEKNYRDRLKQLLNWDINDLQRWMEDYQEKYWASLYSWCSENDFRIARCSPKYGAGRYVQYPVQQAERVFTQKDLKHIAYHFVQHKLQPGEDLSEHEFWRILNKNRLPSYVSTNHGKRLVERRDYIPDALKQVFNFYLRWDGSYLQFSRNKVVNTAQHFLYLSENGYLDIRNKDLKRVKRLDWSDITRDTLAPFYTFRRKRIILFKESEDYEGYWEESRFIEGHGNGYAIVFNNLPNEYDGYYEAAAFSRRSPIFQNNKIKIYRFYWSDDLAEFYTEKKFFSLEGGLKIGRMMYLEGGAPILHLEHSSKFWIDGDVPIMEPIDGELPLNFLSTGNHEIKFPGFKKIEFSIVKATYTEPVWDASFNKWMFTRNPATWSSIKGDTGVVGLDFSVFKMDQPQQVNTKKVLTRWAEFHHMAKVSPTEDNIALKLLKNR